MLCVIRCLLIGVGCEFVCCMLYVVCLCVYVGVVGDCDCVLCAVFIIIIVCVLSRVVCCMSLFVVC